MDTLRELAFLQRLSLTAAQTLESDSLVQLVIDETTGALGVDVCSVYLVEPDGTHLVLSATNGLSQAGVGHVRLKVGQGITGAAAKDRAPVVVPDVREDRRFVWLHGVDQARFVSMCSIPIVSADRLVGVLNVQTDERRVFTHVEVEFLVAIAAQVAGVLERSGMHERLERHLDELRRFERIHRRFTELSLAGAGLQEICDAIAGHASASVALYGEDGACRTRSVGAEGFADDASDLPDASDTFTVHEVRAGEARMGRLAVATDGPRDSVARRAVDQGVTAIALALSRERAALEVEARLHGDVIEALLSGELPDVEVRRLADRAGRLGLGLRRRMWVMVIRPDDEAAMGAFTDPELARTLMRTVVTRVRSRHQSPVVIDRGGALIALVPEPAAASHVERTGELVLDAVARATGVASFSVGVSGASVDVGALHRAYGQAQLAVDVGRRVHGDGRVHGYRRFGAERILSAAAENTDLTVFVDEWLGAMIRQERQGRAAAPLVETIQTLTDVSWSLRAAARRMNIHVNTLQYRLQRARAVSGRDLDDPDVRLSMALALRALGMLGERARAAIEAGAEPEPDDLGAVAVGS